MAILTPSILGNNIPDISWQMTIGTDTHNIETFFLKFSCSPTNVSALAMPSTLNATNCHSEIIQFSKTYIHQCSIKCFKCCFFLFFCKSIAFLNLSSVFFSTHTC